jgi:tol-pal system protein YbgF
VLGLLVAGLAAGGCVPPAMVRMPGQLDSLRVQVDTLMAREAARGSAQDEIRRELAEQREILLSLRAATGSTTRDVSDLNARLQVRIDELEGRLKAQDVPAAGGAAPPGAPDPGQLYEEAAQDLTQGRYPLALSGFREYVARYGTTDLADNAQYGIGECFYAQARFDSAAVEYARVAERWPEGDRVPAAIYKLGLSEEKLGRAAESRTTLEGLVRRFPNSGEAQLARERLTPPKR